MEHTWGTPETQPPEPPQPPDAIRFGTAHLCLLIAVAALTTSVLGAAVDWLTAVTVERGVFAILASVAVGGFCGWTVQSAEVRNRRELCVMLTAMRHRQGEVLDQLAELTSAVEEMRDEAGKAHVAYLPAPRPQGHMHLSQSDGGTVPLMPKVDRPAVDQDALREQVEQVVAEELGTREAVRSQGYAEGYVDGVSRREGDTPPE